MADLRTALIMQNPSLELQRAAHAEICRLDSMMRSLEAAASALRQIAAISATSDDAYSAMRVAQHWLDTYGRENSAR